MILVNLFFLKRLSHILILTFINYFNFFLEIFILIIDYFHKN